MTQLPDRSWNSRTELLLKRADLNDAYEAEAALQRKRTRLALGLLAIGVTFLVLGFTMDRGWLKYGGLALQIPVFGFGLFLMAGQEVRRLKRGVEAIDAELAALDSGEG